MLLPKVQPCSAHAKAHREKPFRCQFCDYATAHKSALTVHLRTHTGEKPFCCKLCNYACANTSALTAHMRTHTGENHFAAKATTLLHKRLASQCTCERTPGRSHFAASMHYAAAQRLLHSACEHTPGKLFRCEVCDYAAAKSQTHSTHANTHRGKPFRCEVCDYAAAKRLASQDTYEGIIGKIKHMTTYLLISCGGASSDNCLCNSKFCQLTAIPVRSSGIFKNRNKHEQIIYNVEKSVWSRLFSKVFNHML